MADESQYSVASDTTPPSLKRKYNNDDKPATHRPTGFSDGPDPSAAPTSYNSVPPPAVSDFELAKQKAQEVAARLLLGGAPPLDAKRPKVDNGAPTPYDSYGDVKSQYSAPSFAPSYGHQGASKKIDIPNGRVGVIIGKGGETIKYLQTQSGAKIQVTRDMDADPNSQTRAVELMGTPEAIASAEKLINEVLTEAESGGSGIVTRRFPGQAGSEEFVMKVPNNKVGLVIGKGGETIKNMQASTGARIQVIPLHLPPGDTSTERTLKIEGTSEQIESAKQLVNSVINGDNRLRNPSMSGGYSQQGYQARPPSSWAPPAAPAQQPAGYGYVQPGGYSGPSPQYNMPQQPYAGYPSQSSGGYPTNWDQSTTTPQQSTHAGYDYYGQQQQQNPGAPAPAADGTAYNYSQPPSSGYNQPGQGYGQDGYGAYQAPPHSGYGQPPSYDQQQGYSSAPSYGSNPAQDANTPNYGSQGDAAQVPPVQPQQGYGSSQQPSPNAANYPPQGAPQTGYGVPPTSQAAYGNPPQVQSGYGPGYGPPQSQKPSGTPPVYGQSQSPNTTGGYGQTGYPPSQPPPSGYSQPETGRAPPSGGYGGAVQPGYGPPPYGAPAGGQPGYAQAPPAYGSSYGAGYPQASGYSGDGNAGDGGNTRGSNDGAPAQAVQQGTVAKASPPS